MEYLRWSQSERVTHNLVCESRVIPLEAPPVSLAQPPAKNEAQPGGRSLDSARAGMVVL